MTDELDKLAREIVKAQHLGVGKVALVRLGLEAGMKLQRERDAAIADCYEYGAGRVYTEGDILPSQGASEAQDAIAQAIRALT